MIRYIDAVATTPTVGGEASTIDKSIIRRVKDMAIKYNLPLSGGLIVVNDATHTGHVNQNMRLYNKETVAKRDYATWYMDYFKPILTHHNDGADPIGRNMFAKWYPRDEEKGLDGVVKVGGIIYDKDAQDKVLDGRLMTVSTGFSIGRANCSICGKDVDRCGQLTCEHEIGQTYDKKQLCYLDCKDLYYKELSYVNTPAHRTAGTVATEKPEDAIINSIVKLYDSIPETDPSSNVVSLRKMDGILRAFPGETTANKTILVDGFKDSDKSGEEAPKQTTEEIDVTIKELIDSPEFTKAVADAISVAKDSAPPAKDVELEAEKLQDAVTELGKTNEGLDKANKELDSTNKVLQDANKELSSKAAETENKYAASLRDFTIILSHLTTGDAIDKISESVNAMKLDELEQKVSTFIGEDKVKAFTDIFGNIEIPSAKTVKGAVDDDRGSSKDNASVGGADDKSSGLGQLKF